MPGRANDLIAIPDRFWQRADTTAALRSRNMGQFFALLHQCTLIKQAQDRNWTVQVIATPAALDFFDPAAIESQTGRPVRSQYRKPGEPRSERSDAIIVAPATYNTINKWARGISDTYALGILAETTSLNVPIVVLPFVNTALASRAPFRRSVEALRAKACTSSSAAAGSNLTRRTRAATSSTPTPGTLPSMKPSA